MDTSVTLSKEELAWATSVGMQRYNESLKRGHKNKHGLKYATEALDVDGACAELAVAKFTGWPWKAGVNTFKEADIEDNIQVKSTPKQDNRLIIRNDDSSDHCYILVVGVAPTFRIVGWIIGRDGKQPQYLYNPNDREPAYFIPQTALNSFDEFIKA